MSGLEALALHRGVGDEAQVHPVGRGDKLLGDLAAAQPAQDGRRVAVPIEGLQVVVGALLMLLDLKLVERLREAERGDQRDGEDGGGGTCHLQNTSKKVASKEPMS